MKKQTNQVHPIKLVEVINTVYRYGLGLFTVVMFAAAGTGLGTFAAEPTGDFSKFNAYVCAVVSTMGTIVGGLAIVMIIAAGIMYALSAGSDKGAVSIGSAKSMITSALAGTALFLMGGVLFGECGSYGYGEWLSGLF